MAIMFRQMDEWDYAATRNAYPDDPSPPFQYTHHERVVQMGGQEVGIVSWLQCEGQVIITQLYVFPPHRNQLVADYILGAFVSDEATEQCRVLCTPQTLPFYEKKGWFRDHGHLLATKVSE